MLFGLATRWGKRRSGGSKRVKLFQVEFEVGISIVGGVGLVVLMRCGHGS